MIQYTEIPLRTVILYDPYNIPLKSQNKLQSLKFRPSESNKCKDVQLINCRLVNSSISQSDWQSEFIVSLAQCDSVHSVHLVHSPNYA